MNVCSMYDFKVKIQRHEHEAVPVAENVRRKILRDFDIQMEHIIHAKRPDMQDINQETNTAHVIDVAIPHDSRMDNKEVEKIENSKT